MDRGVKWHFTDDEGDPCMAPFGAKNLVQELRRSIQYGSLALEAGSRMDESVQTDNLFNTRQLTSCGFQLSNGVDSAESSSLVAVVDGELISQSSGIGELSVQPR